MAEKTSFREFVEAEPVPSANAKCCANCAHARPVPDTKNLRTMYLCKALPPSVIVFATAQGLQNKVSWPLMGSGDECDYFHPKAEPNSLPETVSE